MSKCDICGGRKIIVGLGGIHKPCDMCNSESQVEPLSAYHLNNKSSTQVKSNKLSAKPTGNKRGRKKRNQEETL